MGRRSAGSSLRFTEASFDAGYRMALGHDRPRLRIHVLVAPIGPMSYTGSLAFDSGIEICQLDDDEVIACLRMGAMPTSFPPGVTAFVNNRTAIRMRFKSRELADRFTDEDRLADQEVERGRLQVSARCRRRSARLSKWEGRGRGYVSIRLLNHFKADQ